MRVFLLVIFAVLLSVGQILFKKAAMTGAAGSFFDVLTSFWMVAAVGLYGASAMLWVWLLRFVPLSIAYPFAALGFVLVPLAAAVIFGEQLSWGYALGSILIILGVLTISAMG